MEKRNDECILITLLDMLLLPFKAGISGRNPKYNIWAKVYCSEIVCGIAIMLSRTIPFEDGCYHIWRLTRYMGSVHCSTTFFQILLMCIFAVFVIFVLIKSAYTFIWAFRKAFHADFVQHRYICRQRKKAMEEKRKEKIHTYYKRHKHSPFGYERVNRRYV